MTDENYSGGSGKFDTVTYNIESVVSEGHKILIFSSFVKHLELFPGWLEKNGIGYAMLTGSTRERGALSTASGTMTISRSSSSHSRREV
ncbi:MAG: hypothetical protein MZV63_34890 [Marinilabiliales bacterium]|nr:hypothetical protein [Marinilabiliales bacterium]